MTHLNEEIIRRLTQAFQPKLLKLEDDSGKHKGHIQANGASHFSLQIASEAFEKLKLLEIHQSIYKVLNDLIPHKIHALKIEVIPCPRVVSLIASSTEIICALGMQHCLVGRSHECDHPASILPLPQCTESKIEMNGKSYEIDQKVKAILQEGLSVYRVDAQKLNELSPGLIFTQIQCIVCAVSEKDVKEACQNLINSQPQIISLNTNSLEDLWKDIQNVALALRVPKRGEALIEKLQEKMKGIRDHTQNLVKPKIAFIEWISPLMSCGNWMPHLIEMAGGENLFGLANQHSPWMNEEELLQKDPDIIVIAPCGFDLVKIKKEMPLLSEKKFWSKLKAVQNKQVYLADGNQFFNRPGPRLVESLEILAEIFHPNHFQFKQNEAFWERFLG